MGAYSGPAVLRQGDHSVGVSCDLTSWDDDAEVVMHGLSRWEGTFDAPYPSHVLESGDATIELPGGATGVVVISLLFIGDEETGALTGSGAAPF